MSSTSRVARDRVETTDIPAEEHPMAEDNGKNGNEDNNFSGWGFVPAHP